MGGIVLLLVVAFWLAVVVVWRRGRDAMDEDGPLRAQLDGQGVGSQLRVIVKWATGL